MDRLSYLRNCASAFDAVEIPAKVKEVLQPAMFGLRLEEGIRCYAEYVSTGEMYDRTVICLKEEIYDYQNLETLLTPGWYLGSAGDMAELYENSLCIACEECGETSHIDQWEGYSGCLFCGYNGNVDCGQAW